MLPVTLHSTSSLSTHKLAASLGKVSAQLSSAKGYLALGLAKGSALGPAKGLLRAMAIEIDPLDLVIPMVRPPANFFEEVEAYWSYLECPCGAWLWRRHLGDPTWGVRCYSCNAPWRDTYLQHGFSHWNPVAKRRTLPGDGVDTAR